MRRADLLEQIAGERPRGPTSGLVRRLRWVIPTAVALASAWWLITNVLGIIGAA